jgi:hypothetical protein
MLMQAMRFLKQPPGRDEDGKRHDRAKHKGMNEPLPSDPHGDLPVTNL